jgi:hypothetical protein
VRRRWFRAGLSLLALAGALVLAVIAAVLVIMFEADPEWP